MAGPLPLCHLDGQRLPLREARISPLDRSFLFGDGVYEVIPVYDGKPFRFDAHHARLSRSLAALRIRDPHDAAAWRAIVQDLVNANGGGDQYVYLQVSRGAEYGRNHAPFPDVPPTVFVFCAQWPPVAPATLTQGVACITAEDIRWARCDIKSVALLGNVLLRQQAFDAGSTEALLLREGRLTEASASTVHVVRGGTVITPPNSSRILPGTTRSVVEELLDSLDIPHRAGEVSESELRDADEIWLAAATREVQPVTRLDGKPVGSGVPGPLWRRVTTRTRCSSAPDRQPGGRTAVYIARIRSDSVMMPTDAILAVEDRQMVMATFGEHRQQLDHVPVRAGDAHAPRHDLTDDFRAIRMREPAAAHEGHQPCADARGLIEPRVTHEIRERDDADDPARAIHHRQRLDATFAHQRPGLEQRHGVVRAQHLARHDVAAAQLAEVAPVGGGFREMQQVREILATHVDHLVVVRERRVEIRFAEALLPRLAPGELRVRIVAGP